MSICPPPRCRDCGPPRRAGRQGQRVIAEGLAAKVEVRQVGGRIVAADDPRHEPRRR